MINALRSSTHAFAKALIGRAEGPMRGLRVGRFVVLWDGKRGDYMETVKTSDLFTDQTPVPENPRPTEGEK